MFQKKTIATVIGLLLSLMIGMAFPMQQVCAKDLGGWGPIRHIGKYYFKFNYDNEHVYVSKKKNRGYKKTPVNSDYFATNGKEIIYVSKGGNRDTIKAYRISTKKTRIEKRLMKGVHWEANASKGSYMWLYQENNGHLYRYNIITKKIKRVKKNTSLNRLTGDYYIGTGAEKTKKVSEDTPYLFVYKAVIYKITKTGKMNTVRSLGTVQLNREIFNVILSGRHKTIYYSPDAHKLYRINANGKEKTLINRFDELYIWDIYDSSCCVFEKTYDDVSELDYRLYVYDYATGDLKED